MIRLIIALYLILGSLALDMSSVKNRVSNSAYVELYTELGLTSGFRGEDDDDDFDEEYQMNYYITYTDKDEKVKKIGESTQMTSSNLVHEEDGSLQIRIDKTWVPLLPVWLKQKELFITFPVLEIATFICLKKKSGNYFFNVELRGGKSFQIVLTNGVATALRSTEFGLIEMDEQIENFKNNEFKISQAFIQAITKIKVNLRNVMENIQVIQDAQSKKSNKYSRHIENTEKTLAEWTLKKQKSIAEIEQLNSSIATINANLKKTLALKVKCDEELINITLKIDTEEKRIQARKEEIAKNLQNCKDQRLKSTKRIFYYIEASYFYRVFSEKLIKSEADVLAAVSGTNLKSTQTKIVNAFYPIPIYFAEKSSK